jgi:hypothetical protein
MSSVDGCVLRVCSGAKGRIRIRADGMDQTAPTPPTCSCRRRPQTHRRSAGGRRSRASDEDAADRGPDALAGDALAAACTPGCDVHRPGTPTPRGRSGRYQAGHQRADRGKSGCQGHRPRLPGVAHVRRQNPRSAPPAVGVLAEEGDARPKQRRVVIAEGCGCCCCRGCTCG